MKNFEKVFGTTDNKGNGTWALEKDCYSKGSWTATKRVCIIKIGFKLAANKNINKFIFK